jgi:Tol biopolymer transport system component
MLHPAMRASWLRVPATSDFSWSPDGRYLVFVARPHWEHADAAVILVSVDGRERRVLSRLPADQFAAAWSPHGSRLIYTARVPGDRVVLQEALSTGKGQRVVWRCPARDRLPGVSWPARGPILAAVTTESSAPHRGATTGSLQVVAIQPRTGRARVVARAGKWPNTIAWSHNGRFLAFAASNPGMASAIYRLDLRSGRLKRLTEAPARWPDRLPVGSLAW